MGTQPTDKANLEVRQERRATVRVPVRVAVSLLCIDRKTYGWAVNVSPGGLFVEGDEQFPIGARVAVDALLALQDSVHHLKAEGRVVHTFGRGMGIQFENLPPASVLFVRRLVNHLLYQDKH
jgi:Tfp pilus assembly protein PilZ